MPKRCEKCNHADTHFENTGCSDPNCKCPGLKVFSKAPLPVIPEHTLLEEITDCFDPSKGVNLKLLDPHEIDKDMMILLLGKDENKFGIAVEKFRVEKKIGDKLILVPYDEKGDPDIRNEIAEFIVQINSEQIKKSSIKMVKDALFRKPLKTLRRLEKATKEKKPSKLKTNVGCVYLEIGDEEVLL